MIVAFYSIIAYVPLQIKCLRRSGFWRILATIPILLVIPVCVVTVIGLVGKSNLWPIFLIMAAPVATAYLFLLSIIRHFVIKEPT